MKAQSARWVGYGTLLLLASAISLFKMAAYARLLDVEIFGLVSLLLSSYALVLYVGTLGMAEGLLKTASMVKETGEKVRLTSAGFAFGIVMASLSGLISFMVASALLTEAALPLLIGFSVLCLSAFAFNIIEISARVGMQFSHFAVLVLIKAILSLVFGVSLALLEVAEWILVGEAGAFALVALGGRAFGTIRAMPVLRQANPTAMKTLIREGIPIAGSNLARKLSFTLDRWIVAIAFGAIAISEYSFVMLAHLVGISLLGVINTAFGPTLLSKMSDDSGLVWVERRLRRLLLLALSASIVTVILAYMFLPFILPVAFPKYASPEIVLALTLTVAGMGATFLGALTEWVIIGVHKAYHLTLINGATAIITVIVFAALTLTDYSIVLLCLVFAFIRSANFLVVAATALVELRKAKTQLNLQEPMADII